MAKKSYYGGQAIIEGVMMRGQKTMVNAVRRPDGEVAVDVQPLSTLYSGRLRRTPLLRGVVVMIEAMVLGIKALLYSANIALEEEGEKVSGPMVWLMMVFALGFAVVLFFIVPWFITNKTLNVESSILFHLIEAVIRIVIFVAYLKIMTLMPDIKRVFAYHGAEHKTINAYEAGIPLEVEAVKKYSTAHMRCSTSFLFVVMIIAIVVFTLVGIRSTWLMILARIVLIPVIAAFGYEIIYFGARHVDNWIVKIILTPGLWLQKLTTREPDDSQLEVALTALQKVLDIDQIEEAEQAPA